MVKIDQKKNKEREDRIMMEIIVDAYSPEEQAMGWYYYLEDKLHFPFTAICNAKRAISPLLIKDEGTGVRIKRNRWITAVSKVLRDGNPNGESSASRNYGTLLKTSQSVIVFE